ncbi:MAG: hypothetical protein ACRDPH_06465 [Marmoricola sp.]
MKNKILSAAACALLVTSLAGCGNSGNSDDSQAAQAISKSIMKKNQMGVTQKQADCVGSKMVANVGTKDLQKYKILDKNLHVTKSVTQVKMSKGDAGGAADAIVNCVDPTKFMMKAMSSSSASMPPAARKCMQKVLTKQAVHDMMADSFAGNTSAAQKKLMGPMMKCAQQGGMGQ